MTLHLKCVCKSTRMCYINEIKMAPVLFTSSQQARIISSDLISTRLKHLYIQLL